MLQNRLTYTITNDARCQDVFYIAADTGAVFLREPLLSAPETLFTVSCPLLSASLVSWLYLCLSPSAPRSVCLRLYPALCLPACLPVCLTACLSVYISLVSSLSLSPALSVRVHRGSIWVRGAVCDILNKSVSRKNASTKVCSSLLGLENEFWSGVNC